MNTYVCVCIVCVRVCAFVYIYMNSNTHIARMKGGKAGREEKKVR